MSDDLISRKTIKSQIETIRDCWGTSPFVSSSDMKLYAEAFNVVLQTISDCHTAFDKEKVLSEMRSEYADAIDMYNSDKGTAYAYSSEVRKDAWKKAIEIIEKGGIE